MFWKALSGANFTVTWAASPDPTVIEYVVESWPAVEGWVGPPRREEVERRTFVALQRVPTHVRIYAVASGGFESLPSRTVSYPCFRWMWWTPPWPWVVQSSDDLVSWKDSGQWLWTNGVVGGFDCFADGKKFYRLRP